MNEEKTIYCSTCVKAILSDWKGWPHKNVFPLLPRFKDEACESCGGTEKLESSSIVWLNHQSKYSTGLPDYWLLVIQDQQNNWGKPYYKEICHNCVHCGLTKICT